MKCTFNISKIELKIQQRSVIRYYCLRGKTTSQISASLAKGYGRVALRMRAVENWAARFRDGQETVEDDDRAGRPPKTDFGKAVLQFLETQPHSSSREINKALCSPGTTVLRVLANLGLHFFAPRWTPLDFPRVSSLPSDRVSSHHCFGFFLEHTSMLFLTIQWNFPFIKDFCPVRFRL
jgi:transposase